MVAWLIRTSPLPDECLSSWLTRSALALGTDTQSLIGSLHSSWRPWQYDLDRRGPGKYATKLADRSGLEQPAIVEMTLQPIAEKISGSRLIEKHRWPWILMLGIRGKSRRFGTQYCSLCLRSDPAPYFRRRWRLAWHVVCSQHSTRLMDACPNCSSQVEPHRSRQTDKHIAFCWKCNADLTSFNSGYEKGPAPHIQSRLEGTISNPKISAPESSRLSDFGYYSGLIKSLRRSIATPTAANPTFEYLGEVGNKLRSLNISPVSFEMLRTNDRFQLLGIAHEVQTVCRTFSTTSWRLKIPSDLRRAISGVHFQPSRIMAKPTEERRVKKVYLMSEPAILPRPRHDVDRIWRRLKLRAHAQRTD
jgi:hypothetical protein